MADTRINETLPHSSQSKEIKNSTTHSDTAVKGTQQSEKKKSVSWLISFRSVIINALLLLVPSATFILVKVNTIDKTMEWYPLNIVRFFILYVIILSIFTFKPHIRLIHHSAIQKMLQKTQGNVARLRKNKVFLVLLLFFIIVFPFIVSRYQTKVIIYAISYFIFALGINYTVGYAGILNLGHVLPFAAGAYTFALGVQYFQLNFYPALVLATVIGALCGMCVALVTLRLNGDYLGIVTLALAEIFRLILVNWDSFTSGMRGISGLTPPSIPGIQLGFVEKYYLLYYICLLLCVIGYVISARLERSRFGRSWQAVREDEIAAVSMGINISFVRFMVFSIGGAYAGLAGMLLSSSSTYVSPHVSTILYSITVLSIVILGGMGSLNGIILGTVIIIIVPEYLREFQMYRLLLFGAILVIMMRFKPLGLLPQKRVMYKKNNK